MGIVLAGNLYATQISIDIGYKRKLPYNEIRNLLDDVLTEMGYIVLGVEVGAWEVNWGSGSYPKGYKLTQAGADVLITKYTDNTSDLERVLDDKLDEIGCACFGVGYDTVCYEPYWLNTIARWQHKTPEEIYDILDDRYKDPNNDYFDED